MSAISLRGVTKAWATARAVDNVSFEATAGRFVVPLPRPVYIAYGLVSVSYHWNNFL